MRATQNSYGAPAHLVAQLFTETDSQATKPIAEALEGDLSEEGVRDSIQGALDYLQNNAASLMGFALRSLGSSFNDTGNRRREALVRTQSNSIQEALRDTRPGFDSFLNTDINPLLERAASNHHLRLYQSVVEPRFDSLFVRDVRRRDSRRQPSNRGYNRDRRGGNRRGEDRKPRQPSPKKYTPKKDYKGGKRGDRNGRGRGRGKH